MKKAILLSKKPITRNDGSKAYPLNEADLPKNNGTPEGLINIVEYLNVERSLRYKRKEIDGKVVSTYCNIYAYDYCYLAGVYMPRVWWYPRALRDLNNGTDVPVKYGETVAELNANALYDWFNEHSNAFGWVKQNDLKEAQDLANKGWIVIIVAKQKIVTRSGHITAIIPETQGYKSRSINKVFLPLQSQAGVLNKKYFNDNWFTNPRYVGFGVFAIKP